MAQKFRQVRQRQRHFGIGLEGSHNRQHLRVPLFMRAIPFAREGRQPRSLLKIAAAEGLQRMLPGTLGQQQTPSLPGGKSCAAFALPALAQIVAQLRDQHRGGLLAVVAHMATGPADIELAAGRQQGIQHQLAVIVAARAVAGTLLPGQGHKIEIHARGAARVVAIVHTQQTHHVEGNGAHRHQRAKSHAAGAKALVERGLGQGLQPGLLRHFQRNQGIEARLLAGALPTDQGRVECGAQGLVFIALRDKEVVHQTAKTLGPDLGSRSRSSRLPPLQHAPQQAGQRSGQLGRQAAHFVIGLHAGKHLCLVEGGLQRRPAGIAQQHAAQAEPGAVGITTGRQAQLCSLRMVEPPANARTGHPVRELGQIVGRQTHARRHGGDIEQVAQLAQTAALLRQLEQPLQRRHQRTAGTRAHVGDIKRNMARIVAAVLAEHGADGGCSLFDRRQHDHHLARRQRCAACRGRLGQPLQQLVVQHFELAHQAMGLVKDDGLVGRCDLDHRVLRHGHQIANALLHLGQQRCVDQLARIGLVIHIHTRPAPLHGRVPRGVEGIELAHIVAALPPPCRQQRMGMGVHGRQRNLRQILAALVGMAAALLAQQLAPVDGIGPVKAAGVGNGNQHLAVLGNAAQKLHQRQRHLAHAEHHHAARQRRNGRLAALQRVQNPRQQGRAGGGTLLLIKFGQHLAPQLGLPELPFGNGRIGAARRAQHILALLPGGQPVGAVDLVLVEQVGQLFGQLQQTLRLARAQKVGNRCERRLAQALRQQTHQAPDHGRLVQRRFTRHLMPAQNLPVAAPDKARRQLDLCCGAHALLLGHAHLEPLGHAVALHQHDLGLQRLQGMRRQPGQHGIGQRLGLVAVNGDQARLPVSCRLRRP